VYPPKKASDSQKPWIGNRGQTIDTISRAVQGGDFQVATSGDFLTATDIGGYSQLVLATLARVTR
jgi:hypothetical protein